MAPRSPALGGVFSVALSLALLPVAVSHHRALSSSDFPPEDRAFPFWGPHGFERPPVPLCCLPHSRILNLVLEPILRSKRAWK
jgi:hypothetical protein